MITKTKLLGTKLIPNVILLSYNIGRTFNLKHALKTQIKMDAPDHNQLTDGERKKDGEEQEVDYDALVVSLNNDIEI